MTDGRLTGAVSDDLAWCHDAVQGVSRTFAITIDQLEAPTADYICVGYLLCRVADTVEDAEHVPPTEQAALLRTYEAVLDPEDDTDIDQFRADVDEWIPEDRTADWDVVANAPRVLRTFRALPADAREGLRDPVREMVEGMAEFVERYEETGGLRIKTVDELEEYCWYAAGTVGTLITDYVVRDASPEEAETMRQTSRSFALLLQLVNVAKDVTDDFREENNVYLPREWLREEGVDADAVCDPENTPAVATVIERVTSHASGYLDDAQRYLEVVPESRGNRLSAWAIPYLLAVGTIRELRENPEDVVREGGVKVSREEVFALIERFQGGVDRSEIADLRRQIEQEPYTPS